MKNQNTIFYIIGAVVLVVLIIYSQVPKEKGMVGLTPRFYKDGVEVFPSSARGLFSIVTGPGISGEYDQIAFDIFGTNEGDINLTNVHVVDAYPQAFKDILMSTTPQTLNYGQNKKLWGVVEDSLIMDTVQFEGQTINFWVRVSGEYSGNPIYEESYSGDITFTGIPLVISDITITPSATPLPIDTVVICANMTDDSPITIARVNLHCDACNLGGSWNWGLVMDAENIDEDGHGRYCKELTPTSMKASYLSDPTRSYYLSGRNSLSELVTTTFYYTYTEIPCIEDWSYPDLFYDDFEQGICGWWSNDAELSDLSYEGDNSLFIDNWNIVYLDNILISEDFKFEVRFYDTGNTNSQSGNYEEPWYSCGRENCGRGHRESILS